MSTAPDPVTTEWVPVWSLGSGGEPGPSGDLSDAVILAPADSARNVIEPTDGDVTPVTVRAAGFQTADLQQWIDGEVSVQDGDDASRQLRLGTGGLSWTRSQPFMDVLDVAAQGGNGQFFVRVGEAEWYTQGAEHTFRGRGDSTRNVLLNGGSPWAGGYGPFWIAIGSRGYPTAPGETFRSGRLGFHADYWDDATSSRQEDIGSIGLRPRNDENPEWKDGDEPGLFLNVADHAVSGNESEASNAWYFRYSGRLWFAREGAFPLGSFVPGISIYDNYPHAAATPFAFNSGRRSAQGGVEFWSGGGEPTRQARILGDGTIITRRNAAPDDATLEPGELALWFDPAGARLAVKAKRTDGTVVSGGLALA